MRLVVLLASLLGLSLAASLDAKPKPCKSPPLLSGGISFATQRDMTWFFAPFQYDALQQRIWISGSGIYQNRSSTYSILLLYSEGVMYKINSAASTCTKKPLKIDFMPLGVPDGASLLAQFVFGGSSAPGEGVLVNTWTGQTPWKVKYMVTVSESGCVPISVLYQTQESGWAMLSFINIVKGNVDPSALNPPPYCPGPEVQPEGTPVDIYTLLESMRISASA